MVIVSGVMDEEINDDSEGDGSLLSPGTVVEGGVDTELQADNEDSILEAAYDEPMCDPVDTSAQTMDTPEPEGNTIELIEVEYV